MGAVRPDKTIEQRIGIGTPGGVISPSAFKGDKIDYSISSPGSEDAINQFKIASFENGEDEVNLPTDLIKFRINVIDSVNPDKNDVIVFRAFLDDLSDDFTAGYNSYKYNGRAEKFYTYNEFDRSLSFKFKIAAQTRSEMKPIYQKLNYLVAQTAPEYSQNGRMRAKYNRLTIGDWCNEIPGFFESIGLAWNKNYPWEIALHDDSFDKDANQLPHVLDVSCKFKPIHDFAPENRKDLPYILPERGVLSPRQWHKDS